jgi:hypothetical protein
MGIAELIRELQNGNGDNEVVGNSLAPNEAPVFVEEPPVPVVVEETETPVPVVETEELPVPDVEVVEEHVEVLDFGVKKSRRGRRTVYDTTTMKVGEHIVYNGSLSSGRVLASLKGKGGKKFQATENKGQIWITRKA